MFWIKFEFIIFYDFFSLFYGVFCRYFFYFINIKYMCYIRVLLVLERCLLTSFSMFTMFPYLKLLLFWKIVCLIYLKLLWVFWFPVNFYFNFKDVYILFSLQSAIQYLFILFFLFHGLVVTLPEVFTLVQVSRIICSNLSNML